RRNPPEEHTIQGVGIDRLGEVVIHASTQTLLAAAGHGVGGHGDDRQGTQSRIAADHARGLKSVQHRHLDVHQDQIDAIAGQALDRLTSIGSLLDLQPGENEKLARHLSVERQVIHDQDTRATDRFERIDLIRYRW
ncbi:hypothetical protein RZS08_48590, partial [Arthrospira platensis SPKY1]|nr:hypothetical protein [Arthrospira platensis SPKY1]